MKPNIVLIIADEMRTQNMSLYGYKNETDTEIKRIAKESIFFNHAFTACNSTDPSITSLFTARYPTNNGILHQFPHTTNAEIRKFKSQKQFWLPEYLKGQGYETIAIDWLPLWFKKGFNFFRDREEGKFSKIVNTNRIVNTIQTHMPADLYKIAKKIVGKKMAVFPSPEETTALALKKIKEANKPYFAFIHYGDTHFPYSTTPQPEDKGKTFVPDHIEKLNTAKKQIAKKRLEDIKLNYKEAIIEKYDRSIKAVDKEIGKIYDELKDDNTIFIIMSDHGTNLMEHEIYFDHHGLYDETIKVPIIMHIPGKEGKVVEHLVQNIDLAPTILSLLKEEKFMNLDGRSLMPCIDEDLPIRDHTVSFGATCDLRIAKRTKDKKVIYSPSREAAICYKCKEPHIQGDKIKEEYDLLSNPNELLLVKPDLKR